jgi:CTP synthase (UTP-ammonia lyase)
MSDSIKVGIIGDYDSLKNSHPAANAALQHAAAALPVSVEMDWLPTPLFLDSSNLKKLAAYDCLWASSGSPFVSMQGMLNAIRWARQSGKPFIST